MYRRMRRIERSLREAKTSEEIAALGHELETIDSRTLKLNIPNRYSDNFFSFLIHVNILHTRIAAKKADLKP
jgi:hypothetical protein